MNREFFFDFAMSITVLGLFVGICMSILTKIYLNRFQGRKRYIELIWGVENDWYKGKNFDFIMANVFVSGATFTAWRMKVGLQTKKQSEVGAYAYPELHKNYNYKKLLEEFSTFVLWEFLRNVLLLTAFFAMFVSFGMGKEWW